MESSRRIKHTPGSTHGVVLDGGRIPGANQDEVALFYAIGNDSLHFSSSRYVRRLSFGLSLLFVHVLSYSARFARLAFHLRGYIRSQRD